MNAASSDTSVFTVSPTYHDFTGNNWNIAQNFTLTSVDDNDDSNRSATLTLETVGRDSYATSRTGLSP